MNALTDVSRVQKVTQELNNVLELFSTFANNAEITTSCGRTYKVANVLEKDGYWIVTDLVSRGMFVCNKCSNTPKYLEGDAWLQFTHGKNTVRMHSSLIHLFQKHATEVSSETLEEVAAVFL